MVMGDSWSSRVDYSTESTKAEAQTEARATTPWYSIGAAVGKVMHFSSTAHSSAHEVEDDISVLECFVPATLLAGVGKTISSFLMNSDILLRHFEITTQNWSHQLRGRRLLYSSWLILKVALIIIAFNATPSCEGVSIRSVPTQEVEFITVVLHGSPNKGYCAYITVGTPQNQEVRMLHTSAVLYIKRNLTIYFRKSNNVMLATQMSTG